MPIALFLFIAMPILEIALLLRVGSAIGWVTTLLIVIVTAVLGSAMLRQQGLATLNKARLRMDSGEMPAQQLLEGIMIMIGGVLLLTPGFVTDAFGFACLIPFSRQWLASRIASRAIVNLSGGAGRGVPGQGHGNARGTGQGPFGSQRDTFSADSSAPAQHSAGAPPASGSKRSNQGDIIDGDFQLLDDD